MKRILTLATFMIASFSAVAKYTVVVSCKVYSNPISIQACFSETELKITKNNHTKSFEAWNIFQAGQMTSRGLEFTVPDSFRVKAQNSDNGLNLSITVFDNANNSIFSDETTRKFGVASVRN